MELPQPAGEYILIEELGHGAFGTVYKATDTGEKIMAIKFLQNLPKHQKFTKRELEIVNQDLEHENIVILREHFTLRGRIYIVMEYCEGGDLNDYIVKNEPELKERFNLMVDMSRGVLYLHSQNIVHRDLKPENILLTNNGKRYICKITDFGISRIKENRKEMFSTLCGSPAYMAPEVLYSEPHSNAVDVFSLGLIFFAVHKLVIIRTSLGERSLVPAKITSGKRHEFLNVVMRKEQPSESTFIQTYFKTSVEMGRLVFSMILLDPDFRLHMDQVLIQITENRIRNELHAGSVNQDRQTDTLRMEKLALNEASGGARGKTAKPQQVVTPTVLKPPVLTLDVKKTRPEMKLCYPLLALSDGEVLVVNIEDNKYHVIRLDKRGCVVNRLITTSEGISGLIWMDPDVIILHPESITRVCLQDGRVVRRYTGIDVYNIQSGISIDEETLLLVDRGEPGGSDGCLFTYSLNDQHKKIKINNLNHPRSVIRIREKDKDSDVFIVCERRADTVNIYNSTDFTLLRRITRSDDGPFSIPTCVIELPTEPGTFLVADRDNHRVSMFNTQGTFIRHVLSDQHHIEHPVRLSFDFPYLWMSCGLYPYSVKCFQLYSS